MKPSVVVTPQRLRRMTSIEWRWTSGTRLAQQSLPPDLDPPSHVGRLSGRRPDGA
jgi:hypothetical protein